MMKKVIMLLTVTTMLVSCGGNKNIVTKRPEKHPAKEEVSGTVKGQKKPQKEAKKETKKETLPALSYQAKIQNYISEFGNIAKNEMKLYGIPASITLAQGILESGAGYGGLTQRSKNHFGIKCHNWKGDSVYHDDDRSQECFRKYEHPKESFRDHSLFLANRKRYAKLFTLKKTDYKGWAKGLKAAGYATDKKYPSKLISIIERYGLDAFDKEVLGVDDRKKEPLVLAVEKTTKEKEIEEVTKVVKHKEIVRHIDESEGEYTVKKGDTLYSISKLYKITVQELKTFNNLKNNTIKVGQVLKVVEDDEFEF